MFKLLLPTLLPLIIGPISFFLVQLLKRGIAALDSSPAFVKQIVTFVVACATAIMLRFIPDLVPGACVLGDNSLACLTSWTQGTAVQALLGWLIAHVLHVGAQSDAKK